MAASRQKKLSVHIGVNMHRVCRTAQSRPGPISVRLLIARPIPSNPRHQIEKAFGSFRSRAILLGAKTFVLVTVLVPKQNHDGKLTNGGLATFTQLSRNDHLQNCSIGSHSLQICILCRCTGGPLAQIGRAVDNGRYSMNDNLKHRGLDPHLVNGQLLNDSHPS
jgi:hypothetical protein